MLKGYKRLLVLSALMSGASDPDEPDDPENPDDSEEPNVDDSENNQIEGEEP